MSCDGPHYEHINEQGIVALITGDNKKEADESVEDEIGVSQPFKCFSCLSHTENGRLLSLLPLPTRSHT